MRPTELPEIEIKFTIALSQIPENHKIKAELKAKEAYIMTLVQQGDISSGRAAKILGISRLEILDLMDIYNIPLFDDELADELENQISQTKKNLEKLNQ